MSAGATDKMLATTDGQQVVKPVFYLFRHFHVASLVAIVAILSVAGLGLRHVLRNLVVLEAEDDAIRVSTAARDHEMHRYIKQHYSKNERFLTIPPAELSEVDDHMRVFIAPFNIVKIKIFNTEPRVIYSTDPKVTGKLDPNNSSLLTALAGTPISKYEHKDEVWDLDDEERINVEIVETYVPIYGPDGKIIGSFEIYKDITRNLAMADKIFVRSWFALAVTVLGVFATLMYVIHRAIQTINSGAANLVQANNQLQQEIAEHARAEAEKLKMQNKHSNFLSLVRDEFKSRERAGKDTE